MIPDLEYTGMSSQMSWKLLEYEPIFRAVVSVTKDADSVGASRDGAC